MAPKKAKDAPILNEGQVSLLVQVAKHSQSGLNTSDWDKIAISMGITNAKAAKERFRYLMAQLKDRDEKKEDTNSNGTEVPKGPPKTPKKRAGGAGGRKGGSVKKAKTSARDAAEDAGDDEQNGGTGIERKSEGVKVEQKDDVE